MGVSDTITIPPAIMPVEWRLPLRAASGGWAAGASVTGAVAAAPTAGAAAAGGAAAGSAAGGVTHAPPSHTRSPLQSVSLLHCACDNDATLSSETPASSPKTLRILIDPDGSC